MRPVVKGSRPDTSSSSTCLVVVGVVATMFGLDRRQAAADAAAATDVFGLVVVSSLKKTNSSQRI